MKSRSGGPSNPSWDGGSEHDDGDGAELFKTACRMGLEGIVSKRADSFYRSDRVKSWVKVKNRRAPGWMRVNDGMDG